MRFPFPALPLRHPGPHGDLRLTGTLDPSHSPRLPRQPDLHIQHVAKQDFTTVSDPGQQLSVPNNLPLLKEPPEDSLSKSRDTLQFSRAQRIWSIWPVNLTCYFCVSVWRGGSLTTVVVFGVGRAGPSHLH